MGDQQKPVILIVHGAWHRPWHYRALINDFRAKGYTVAAPTLVSSGEDDSIVTKTYHDDAARCHDALSAYLEQGRTVIGIGHSYGGVVLGAAILGHTVAERESKGLKGGFVSAAFIAAVPALQKGPSLYEAAGNQWLNPYFHHVEVRRKSQTRNLGASLTLTGKFRRRVYPSRVRLSPRRPSTVA